MQTTGQFRSDIFSGWEKGFTLIEVMVSIVVSAIIFGAIYAAFLSQQKSTDTQIEIAQMQQNLRAANTLMVRDLRVAGFDPTGDANATITAATSTSITVTMDLRGDVGDPDVDGDGIPDPDGDLDDEGETVTYSFYVDGDNVPKIGRLDPVVSAVRQPVAEYIEALEFFYTMADDSTSLNPATPDDIRNIQVSIVARSERGDPAIVNNSTSFTFASGANWTPVNPLDNFRRRFITTEIQPRNKIYKDL